MTRSSRHRTWWLVLALLVLSPICAEYLSAYDDSTSHPATLLGNLIIFIPLYGCAALLIREVARRARLGWTGILLLAAAFGLIEAGLVDQSLFSPDYRGLDGWEATYTATLIAPLGLSVTNLIGFVGGHVMLSIAGPIALVEAWRPTRATEPWLRRPGLVITALAYAVGSAFVLYWHLQTEELHASVGQLVGTGVVVVALVVAAVLTARRSRTWSDTTGPGLGRTAVIGLALALAYNLLPQTWLGVAGSVALLVLAGVLVSRASRMRRWGTTHVAIAGAAPLLLTAALGFTYEPMIGEVDPAAKVAHNAVMVAIVLIAFGVAWWRRSPEVTEFSVVDVDQPARGRARVRSTGECHHPRDRPGEPLRHRAERVGRPLASGAGGRADPAGARRRARGRAGS